MPSLVFDKGYKEYDINGDKNCVIRVYTSDWNLLPRLHELKKKIVARVRTLKNVSDDFETAMNEMGEVERAVRAEIDAAFGSPVSEAAFGGVNCLSFAGGQPIVLNFLEAIVPEIQKEFEAETQQASERIAEYADAVKQFD